MDLSAALKNIGANYRFHASLRGSRLPRLGYLTLYYLFYIVLRWGDRNLRAIELLRRLGLPGRPVRVRTPDGHWMAMDLHTAFDPLFFIHADRTYDSEPGFGPEPGWRVLDVGANIGVYTLFAASRVGPSGTVVAVEPHPGNFKTLQANARASGLGQIKLVEAAAGASGGRGELFIHERQIHHSMVRATGRRVPVTVVSLDRLVEELGLPRVDLLKIDTEGTLPAVIAGARGLIARWRPRITFERDSPEECVGLYERLAELGYKWREVGPMTFARPK